ncbi:CRISPR-associated protein Cas4 [Corynebacterium pseudotuberculosis]|uniref:type I-E CRISPR-associated protein Cas7/Cse4/CasC n=1 Tax=Corynebacterium pseudotuberculosis TaxID=1719 RepID=UPI000B42A1FC|nr:type I-E CRISPR-associated protein Cas7/Cse4/CasC [Corynebacterium pseudotuberculosis]ARX64195.1 CRISPR-associated protein Cas4 [Corynebacterium pseudotuberculosis]
MSRHLTIHVVASVPYSNLNRDDSGTPKNVRRGGVTCALLSSQSIKKGIRTKYEDASLDTSVRSGRIADDVLERAKVLAPEADTKALEKAVKKIIGTLTKAAEVNESEDESDRSIWLSAEELEAAAVSVVEQAEKKDFIEDGRTGSLAIAAFGRMFAAAPKKGTEAALSVSPAVTTHGVTIATDYFSTIDDIRERNRDVAGATYLGVAQYTTGVFYRTVTIDKEQLRESWTGLDREDAKENLAALVNAIIYGLPRGKQHSTAPFVQPALILAEEQSYRCAYDFESPVQADAREGGYLKPTMEELKRQYDSARAFDADNFGETQVVSGTYPEVSELFAGAKYADKNGFIDEVVAWIQR